MAPKNRASWLMEKQSPVNVIDAAPYTPPSTNELVIKTKAIALNPADHLVQSLGIIIKQFPAILGCDVAGEVVEVDSSLAGTYQVGDRVIGTASCMRTKEGVYCYSGFQEYVVLTLPFIAKIPKEVSFEEASVLPLGINTSSTCMFAKETLGLKAPSKDGKKEGKGRVVIVWGASSSVGSCGVQQAAFAGYEVVGVASKKNFEMVKECGASTCFDYHDSSLVEDILTYLKGKEDKAKSTKLSDLSCSFHSIISVKQISP
jgi:NADPH:quinone reductase-like Zn-dependent oxidoreductase